MATFSLGTVREMAMRSGDTDALARMDKQDKAQVIIPAFGGMSAPFTCGHSECAVSLGIAGKVISGELVLGAHAILLQVYVDGAPFSFPILPGEAGVYRNANGQFFSYL